MDFCPVIVLCHRGSAGLCWSVAFPGASSPGAPDAGCVSVQEMKESSRERKRVPEEPEWEFAVPELIAAGDEADAGIASLPEHLTGKSSKIPSVTLAPLLPCPGSAWAVPVSAFPLSRRVLGFVLLLFHNFPSVFPPGARRLFHLSPDILESSWDTFWDIVTESCCSGEHPGGRGEAVPALPAPPAWMECMENLPAQQH